MEYLGQIWMVDNLIYLALAHLLDFLSPNPSHVATTYDGFLPIPTPFHIQLVILLWSHLPHPVPAMVSAIWDILMVLR